MRLVLHQNGVEFCQQFNGAIHSSKTAFRLCGLGRTWKDLKGYGSTRGTWKNLKGLERTWKDLEGLGRTWRDLKGLGRT